MIARVVESALADHVESLARRTTENYIDVTLADLRIGSNVVAINVRNAAADRRAAGEIEFVGGGVDWIVLHCGKHVLHKESK